MADPGKLPDYATMLSDYHRAYAIELKAMVAGLPIREGDKVLEMACGDGVYARWLAERVGPSGSVTALDVSSAFLNLAQENAGAAVGFVAGAVERMPFADDTFDLVWCAQSLYSLPDPVEAVRTMRRVVKPGGVVAVLENDTLHHILLPWPVEVELAVRAAELVSYVEDSDRPRKYYVGRQLDEVFRKAGLEQIRKRTWATNRQAPLDGHERGYLGKYLGELLERTRPHLDPQMRERFEGLAEPGSGDYLLDREDMTVTCLDHVVWGVKPVV
ncbi:MAG: methyltransferase domain-containing protein [Planctomycetia bacterium]|nr:methyltransferase domain-containing protein [Planctomycetia bacterium]